MDLKEFRKKNPAYNDWSDQELANGLYQKYYSDMPFDSFASQIGYTPPAKEETPVAEEPAKGIAAVAERPQTEAKTSNPFMGLLARGSSLIGQGVEGLTRGAETLGKKMESSLTEEERAGMKALQEKSPVPALKFDPDTYTRMQNTATELKNWGADIGYSPSTKLGELPGNPLKVVPFIAERVITSSPDMAAAMTLAPAYVVARTNEILNERIKNDEKKLEDVTVSDVAIAAGAAALETYLEKMTTGRLFKPTGAGGSTMGRVGKELAIQSGTEGIEEGIGYLGGAAGTKKGIDPRELAEQMIEGAIVGGGLGAGAQGAKEFISSRAGATPPPEREKEKPKFEIDPETGVLREVKPEEVAAKATPPAPLTKQGELFTTEEAPYQVTPGDVSVEAQAKQQISDRAAQDIEVLKQRLATAASPQEVATIRDDISKLEALVQETPEQRAVRLGDEFVTLYRKGDALTEQKAALEAARDAEKTLDGKATITEQIKAIDAQLGQIIGRQEELSAEGKKLEKEGVSFGRAKDSLDLKGPSPIVGNVMSKFGLPPKALIRQRIKNLDMTDPEERATFEQEIFDFDAKFPNKLNLEAVQSYIDAFTPVQEEAVNEPRTIPDAGAGTSLPSVRMPSGQPGTPAGTTALTTPGLASPFPVVGGAITGAGTPAEIGQGALTPQAGIAAPSGQGQLGLQTPASMQDLAQQATPPVLNPTMINTTNPALVDRTDPASQWDTVAQGNVLPAYSNLPEAAKAEWDTSNRDVIAAQDIFQKYIKEIDAISDAQKRLQNTDIHNELTTNEKQAVAEHYGEDSYNDVVKSKFVQDVITALTQGLDKVAAVLRNIIKRLQAGALAAVIAINTSAMSPPINFAIPAMDTKTEVVMAQVPVQAASKMSDGAKRAYGVLYPAMKQYLQENNKLFIMTDKPSARMFIFNPDGSLLLERKVLLGRAFGDYYKGNTDFRANRITPAGLFTMSIRQNNATAADYDFQTVFGFEQIEDGSKYFVTTMHSVWMHERDNQERMAALQTEGTADARMSFGCINIDKPTFAYLFENHLGQINGAKTFIVPDNPADTMSFINGEAVQSKDMVRDKADLVTKTVKTPKAEVKAQETGKPVGVRREDFVTAAPISGREAAVSTGPTQETVANVERTGNLTGNVTEDLVQNIAKNNVKGALQDIANDTTGAYSDIEREVAQALLQAKTLPTVEVVDSLPNNADGQYDSSTDTIKIVVGKVDSHSVLHEVTHAFLHKAIMYFEARAAKGLDVNKDFTRLQDIFKYLVRSHPELKTQYAMKSLSEFASEVMSNQKFQNTLKNIKYQRGTVVSEFARRVLGLLGITGQDSNVFAEAIIAVQKLAPTGRAMQENKIRGAEAGIAPLNDAFKRWFGDSKVVNPDGSPMVVYHGTTQDISQFKVSKEGSLGAGIYMTPKTAFANNYAGMPTPSELADIEAKGLMPAQTIAQMKAVQETGELVPGQIGGNVLPVYASIKNPIVINTVNRGTDPAVDLLVALGVPQAKAEAIVEKAYEDKGGLTKEVVSRAQKQGYDGIMQYKDGVLSEVVAFSPYQVKSAIGNTGDYSQANANIAYIQRSPEAEKAAKDSEGFAKSAGPVPKAGFFRRTADKLRKVREGNLNIGSAMFGNLQNFAANNQAFLNLMRKTALDLESKGSITHAQAEGAMLGLIGAQISQRGQLSVQMMDNGNWTYDPITNTYNPVADKDNMAVFGDLATSLAKRLGVDPEVALKYIDQALEANRLQSVDDKLIKAKTELTRAEKRIEFLENDVKRQRPPKGTKTAVEQRKFDRDEDARIEKATKELNLKKALVKELQQNIELYTDQMMHKDRGNIQAGMNLYNDHPEIQEATRVWNVMRQRVVDLMVETGLLTEEKAQRWMDEAAYVPFFREMESVTEESQYAMTKGLRETMAPLRAKYKGSMLEVASVSTNMRQWMQWAIAGSISNRQIKRMLDQYQAWLPEEVREGRDPNKGNFTVMENGVERTYNVDNPDVAQAFIQQATYVFPLMKAFKGASDIARKNVSRNPLFSLSQIPSDLYAAMFTSGIRNPGSLVVRLLSEAVKTTVNMSQTRKDLIRRGLLNTHEYNAQLAEDSIKYAQDIVPPSMYRRVMHVMDKFGAFSDNVIRQAVYNQLISEGSSPQKAETAVVEIMNFRNKSGLKSLNTAASTVVFFNSWLQSLALVLKTLSGKGITYQTRADGFKTLGIVSAKIAAFSFLLAALSDMGDDEDEYARRSRAGKNRIFGIPGTDGMGLAVREDVYVLPHILAQYAYRYMFRNANERGVDTKSLKDSFYRLAKNTFVPPAEGVPQFIRPTAEGLTGVDFHSGLPIVPEHMKDMEPFMQFNANTAEYAKWLGYVTNTSPLQIEHFIKGYLGTTAQLFDMVFGGLIAEGRGIPKPAETTREKLGKLPSVGASFGKDDNLAVAEDLYEVKKDFDRSLKTYKKLNETDNRAAEKYRDEHKDMMHNAAGTVKELENIKRRENYIRNLPSKEKNPEKGMTAEEKAEELAVLKERKDRLTPLVRNLRQKANY